MSTQVISARYIRNGDTYEHRGILKTVLTTVILTNTVNVVFTDGTTHFMSRGTLITLITKDAS